MTPYAEGLDVVEPTFPATVHDLKHMVCVPERLPVGSGAEQLDELSVEIYETGKPRRMTPIGEAPDHPDRLLEFLGFETALGAAASVTLEDAPAQERGVRGEAPVIDALLGTESPFPFWDLGLAAAAEASPIRAFGELGTVAEASLGVDAVGAHFSSRQQEHFGFPLTMPNGKECQKEWPQVGHRTFTSLIILLTTSREAGHWPVLSAAHGEIFWRSGREI